MKITTQDIIKMLGFEEEFKNTLLSSWDSLSSDKKIVIGQILWDEYAALYDLTFEKNLNIALEGIAEGKEKLDKELYKRLRQQTESELQLQYSQTVPAANLSETRDALQEIIEKNPDSDQ